MRLPKSAASPRCRAATAQAGASTATSYINVRSFLDSNVLHSVSFWDALIVRAAQVSRCSVLYSEDMHSGWSIDGLEIANPFAG